MFNFNEEAKMKYNNTKEYKEYESKQKTKEEIDESGKKLMEIFSLFGSAMKESDEKRGIYLVKVLQDFISLNYYTCSKEILKSLGTMYITDERFKDNIDKAGGEGTAYFVNQMINKCLNS